jgi:hypothetical protein
VPQWWTLDPATAQSATGVATKAVTAGWVVVAESGEPGDEKPGDACERDGPDGESKITQASVTIPEIRPP